MQRAEKAREYFKQGYACSQAVALAFKDLVGVSEEDLIKLTLPFGGGFGRLRLVCGAVSGMTAITGLIFSGSENSQENKLKVYEIERELLTSFQNEFGSLICKELLEGASLTAVIGGKPDKRNEEYYKKRPCDEIVYRAAEILENYLTDKGII